MVLFTLDLAFALTLEITRRIGKIRGGDKALTALNEDCVLLLNGVAESGQDVDDPDIVGFLNEMKERARKKESQSLFSSVSSRVLGERKEWAEKQNKRIEIAYKTMTTKFLVRLGEQLKTDSGTREQMNEENLCMIRVQLLDALTEFRTHFNADPTRHAADEGDIQPLTDAMRAISNPPSQVGTRLSVNTAAQVFTDFTDFRLPPLSPVMEDSVFGAELLGASGSGASVCEVKPRCVRKHTPPVIAQGNLAGFMDDLTSRDDIPFQDLFLKVYHDFTTPDAVLSALISRFKLLRAVDAESPLKQKERIVKLLVAFIATIGTEAGLSTRINAFATLSANNLAAHHQGLIRMALRELSRQRSVTLQPASELGETHLALNPTQLACALALHHGDLRARVGLMDYLVYEVAPDRPSALMDLIIEHENLVRWLRQLILASAGVIQRTKAVKQLVRTAEKCRELQDYDALSAFATALDWKHKPMSMLPRTRKELPSEFSDIIDSTTEVFSSDDDYQRYKDTCCRRSNYIPWLDAELHDVLATLGKYPKDVPAEEDLINFDRYRHLAARIQPYTAPASLSSQCNREHIDYVRRWSTPSFSTLLSPPSSLPSPAMSFPAPNQHLAIFLTRPLRTFPSVSTTAIATAEATLRDELPVSGILALSVDAPPPGAVFAAVVDAGIDWDVWYAALARAGGATSIFIVFAPGYVNATYIGGSSPPPSLCVHVPVWAPEEDPDSPPPAPTTPTAPWHATRRPRQGASPTAEQVGGLPARQALAILRARRSALAALNPVAALPYRLRPSPLDIPISPPPPYSPGSAPPSGLGPAQSLPTVPESAPGHRHRRRFLDPYDGSDNLARPEAYSASALRVPHLMTQPHLPPPPTPSTAGTQALWLALLLAHAPGSGAYRSSSSGERRDLQVNRSAGPALGAGGPSRVSPPASGSNTVASARGAMGERASPASQAPSLLGPPPPSSTATRGADATERHRARAGPRPPPPSPPHSR
ncbi:Ras GEF [Mycena kentingensis (nom. inval.)]|nr:Ras GEF [Mycena kentingensis (nom. inval.)]